MREESRSSGHGFGGFVCTVWQKSSWHSDPGVRPAMAQQSIVIGSAAVPGGITPAKPMYPIACAVTGMPSTPKIRPRDVATSPFCSSSRWPVTRAARTTPASVEPGSGVKTRVSRSQLPVSTSLAWIWIGVPITRCWGP